MRHAVVGAMLFVVATFWGTDRFNAYVRAGHHPFYYQSYYEPAVMTACGKGFLVTPPGLQPPALRAFLAEQTDGFSCSQLPADLPLGTDGLYQRPWRYLMTTVAMAWMVLGISWSGLAPMFGVLFGATIALTYAVCRQIVGEVASVLCAAVIAVSPLQLSNLPNLRDYAKAPFTLALVWMLIVLVVRRFRPRDLLLLSLAYGVVLGIGYGFRTDLLIDIPPFLATVLLFVPGGLLRNLGWKIAAIVLCAAGFLVAGWPIISSAVQRGGCQWHVFLLGLTSPFNAALGVKGGSYSWGRLYNDEYVWANVSTYASRFRPDLGFLEFCSPEYDAVSGEYVRQILLRFPADLATRAYAAAIHVLGVPFDRLRLVTTFGIAAAAAFVGIVRAIDFRVGLFAVVAIAYFTGYPAIQFMPRHFFPFEFVGWVVLAFLAEQGVRSAAARRLPDLPWRAAVRFVVVTLLVLAAPLWLMRLYQSGRVVALLRTYVDAPSAPIAFVPVAPGRFRTEPPPRVAKTAIDALATLGRERARFLEIAIDPARCRAETTVTFVYDRTHPAIDFTHQITLDRSDATGPTRIFEPIYSAFVGVDVSDGSTACAPRFTLASDLDREPLLLPAQLTAGWDSRSQYQQIRLFR